MTLQYSISNTRRKYQENKLAQAGTILISFMQMLL
jgi:hypothetical protein